MARGDGGRGGARPGRRRRGLPCWLGRIRLATRRRCASATHRRPARANRRGAGSDDATTVDVLRAAGYRAAVTTAPGAWQFAGSPYQLARVRVPGGGTIRDFHAALTRALGPGLEE